MDGQHRGPRLKRGSPANGAIRRFTCEWGETGVNKHWRSPLERARGAPWKGRPLRRKGGHSCVFTSSTPSVNVAAPTPPMPVPPPPPPPPPPTPPGWTVLTHPLLPPRQTNVISFVDLVRLRSGPLSLCGGVILLWATVKRAPTPAAQPGPRAGLGRSAPVCWLTTGGARGGGWSALGETHVPHTTYLHTQAYRPRRCTATCQSAGARTPEPKRSRKGGKKIIKAPAEDMQLQCLLHVLWHIHYWECKWKCSGNTLKNSQGAGRERDRERDRERERERERGCCVSLSRAKGQKAPRRSDILWGRSGREGGHWFHAFCWWRLERGILSLDPEKRQQVGKGATAPTGQRERRWGFCRSPSWKIVLFSAPFRSLRQDPSYRAIMEMQLWSQASPSFSSSSGQSKGSTGFFFKFYYAPSSIKHVSAPNMCMFPTFSSPQLFDICGDAFKNGCKKENYGDFVSVFFLAAPEKKSCSSLHHVNLPIKCLQRRTAQGVGLWEKKKKKKAS